MNLTASVWLLLLTAFLAASYPFVTSRVFGVIKLKSGKPKAFWVRMAELIVLYFLVGVLALALEASHGNVQVQGWQFYAVTFLLFVVLAYPAFVWRYLWRRGQHHADEQTAQS